MAVRSSLEESQRYIGRGVISGVYVGVSGTHITCLNTKEFVNYPGDINHIGADQLRELIESAFPEVEETQEVLHIIPIGYQVDGLSAVRNPVGLHAGQVEVEAHVVLGDAAVLRNTVKAVEASKVSVKSLVVHSLASAEATLTGDEREMGVVLVDIGGGTSDVMIYRQGNPWFSSVIPVGGNQLTRDLAVAMRIPFYVAEEVKVKWGHALPEVVPAEDEVVVPSFQGQPRRIVKRRSLGEPLQARLVELLKLVLLRVRQAGAPSAAHRRPGDHRRLRRNGGVAGVGAENPGRARTHRISERNRRATNSVAEAHLFCGSWPIALGYQAPRGEAPVPKWKPHTVGRQR